MSKLIPKHQTPSQPLVLSQDNTRIESPYIESIPITETALYKQYLADPYKNSDFNTWKKRQELIQSNRKDEKVKADNRSSKVKEQETKQGEAIHNQQQRKELESKVNKGIWTGIGLVGLALAQATPAAPYIDARRYGLQHLLYGKYASGKRGLVRNMSSKNYMRAKQAGLDVDEFKIGLEKRPLVNGHYDNNPIYEDIYNGYQTQIKADDFFTAVKTKPHMTYEYTDNGIQKILWNP